MKTFFFLSWATLAAFVCATLAESGDKSPEVVAKKDAEVVDKSAPQEVLSTLASPELAASISALEKIRVSFSPAVVDKPHYRSSLLPDE